MFYDDSIPPGTKTIHTPIINGLKFYDDSIPPGTKTYNTDGKCTNGFMMTQFLQVLKLTSVVLSLLSGFMMTQFLQVLKHKIIMEAEGYVL